MLAIGSYIEGKYKILNKIGQGGMSVVYLAMNEKANKQWAVKEVRKDGMKDFEAVKQGLVVETELLKKLNHPNLPSIIDVIENQDTLLIVMDYIEGNPLSQSLEEFGAQPQEHVIEWAKQLCDVMGYLHSRDPAIIYRDMKPSNIMLKPNGSVTLIDFGTAREFKEKNLADTTCLGTVGYAAPEQFGGMGQTDARTDIYCLGATLYHLVTGQNPCEPPYEIRPIREVNPMLSSGFERIILKCTQRNPDDRYQSCEELMYDLENYEQIDDKYRKKQKRKLHVFFASVLFTFVFAGTSLFGYVSAAAKQSENYELKLAEASNAQLSQKERAALYLEAIQIDRTDTQAYKNMLKLFLASDETTGSFTVDEAGTVTRLKAGIDVKDGNGYTTTIYPLDELKTQNPQGYEEVCYEIGMAYWYDYEVENNKYSSAVEWFENAVEAYPIARVFCDIGQIQQQIKKFAGQDRTEDMYHSYSQLWDKLSELKTAATNLTETDTKIIVWKEIINTASDKAAYFLVSTSQDEMNRVLEGIREEATALKNTTQLQDIKQVADTVLQSLSEAQQRIHSAGQY